MFPVCSGQYLSKVVQGRNSGEPVTGTCSKLTDACGERRLARIVRSNRQATVSQNEVNAASDRKVSKYKVHCSLLRMGLQTSQGAYSYPCQPLKALSMGTWASELDHGAMEEGGLVWWIMFSFTSCGWPGVCVSLTWETHGTRKHYGKKASRQIWCFGQCSDLGSCYPCGCYFDMYHLPKHCCRLCTPFHVSNIPWWLVPQSKSYEVLTWPPNFPDLYPIKHLWDVLDKPSDPWRPDLATYRT